MSLNWNIMLVMSLVQKSKESNLSEELVLGAIMKYRWTKEIILDSPCLSENQMFDVIYGAGHNLHLNIGYTPWIRDNDVGFGIELYSVLHYCPNYVVDAAKMFVFFEHLLTHHSLETVIAATMNNIAPRADKRIKDFSSMNMWYIKLDKIFNFALGPVLATFSTTEQLEILTKMKPPFLDDFSRPGDGYDCKGSVCLSGKDLKSAHLQLLSGGILAQISHPPHLDINTLSASAFIPFCAFKTSVVISEPPTRLPNLSYPLCSAFQPTILEGQLCYKLQMNTTSGEGKSNQLMLLLDYNEDRSTFASLDQTEDVDSTEMNTLNMGNTDSLQTKEAEVHIDTLSSFKGFGGGTYKMTVVKKMAATDDFLNMPSESRKCEIEPYEECRKRKLLKMCSCVPSPVPGFQVRVLSQIETNYFKIQNGEICGPKGWDCMEENGNKNFSCSVTCEGIYADVQIVKEQLTETPRKEHNRNEDITTTEDNRVLWDEIEKLRASIGGEEQEEDNEKVSRLVNQYKEFKKMNLPNFLFNPQKGIEDYCKWNI